MSLSVNEKKARERIGKRRPHTGTTVSWNTRRLGFLITCGLAIILSRYVGSTVTFKTDGGRFPVSGGSLSALAAQMQPGTWAVLNTSGFNNGDILVTQGSGCTTGDYVTQFMSKATWDASTKKYLLYGASHGTCYVQKFDIYTDSTNTWSAGPLYPGTCSGTLNPSCFEHGYEHDAVDPVAGNFYYGSYNSASVH